MRVLGNFTALISPFNKNGDVDFDKLKELLDFQLDNGTDGLVILGATGEAHLLDSYEKRKIMQFVVKHTQKRVPIVAGLTKTSTDDLIDEAHARYLDGADALLVCTPSYIKPTQNALLKQFTQLADSSYIPIILYNNPSRTGVNLEYETIKKLSGYPNIIGIKEANTNFSHICKVATLISEDFSLICGNDEFLLPFLSLGASASISVVGNIMPDLVHDVIDIFKTSPTKSQKFYNFYNPILSALSLAPNPVAIKYIMQQLDMIKANLRKPLCLPEKKIKALINKHIKSQLSI